MPPYLEWSALILGLIGTALGIYHTIQQVLSSNVRLSIKAYPVHIISGPTEGETFLCVEVANKSTFPVTIKDVAFKLLHYPGRSIDGRRRCSDGSRLPRRIESRDSVQVLFPYGDRLPQFLASYENVIVETACGKIEKLDLSDLRQQFSPSERKSDTPPII